MSVKEYLIAVRLKKARQDVLFSNYTILEITYLHGFPNLKSFINAFKKFIMIHLQSIVKKLENDIKEVRF